MTEHTPGPWRYDDSVHGPNEGIIHIRAGDWMNPEICTMWASSLIMKEGENGLAENYANARLIAAAPEMLKALKALLSDEFQYGPDSDAIWQHAENIIAKAEGRS